MPAYTETFPFFKKLCYPFQQKFYRTNIDKSHDSEIYTADHCASLSPAWIWMKNHNVFKSVSYICSPGHQKQNHFQFAACLLQ